MAIGAACVVLMMLPEHRRGVACRLMRYSVSLNVDAQPAEDAYLRRVSYPPGSVCYLVNIQKRPSMGRF